MEPALSTAAAQRKECFTLCVAEIFVGVCWEFKMFVQCTCVMVYVRSGNKKTCVYASTGTYPVIFLFLNMASLVKYS